MKDVLILILKAAMIDMKRRCEQNTCEESRDTYGKWHTQLQNMVDTILNGGVK
jgi:hypothetical protein|tara:strand:- start:155 stop:313 length:159 start_codon:yes stop_codon:yes gene_type:complete